MTSPVVASRDAFKIPHQSLLDEGIKKDLNPHHYLNIKEYSSLDLNHSPEMRVHSTWISRLIDILKHILPHWKSHPTSGHNFSTFAKKIEMVEQVNHNELSSKPETIVLDLDDLATAVAPAASKGGTGLAGLQAGILIGGGALALYGTYTAVNQIFDATENLKILKAQENVLQIELDDSRKMIVVPQEHLSDELQELVTNQSLGAIDTQKAALSSVKNRQDTEKFKRFFSGYTAAGGTSLMAAGVFTNPTLWKILASADASTQATLTTVSGGCMYVAIPLISIFAGANAAKEGYEIAKTFKLSNRSLQERLPRDIYEGMTKRLQSKRTLMGLSGAGYTGLAVGAPLTMFALGPLGLPILVPGVGTMVAADFLKKKHVDFTQQINPKDLKHLRSMQSLYEAYRYAKSEQESLDQLKHASKNRATHAMESYLWQHWKHLKTNLAKNIEAVNEELNSLYMARSNPLTPEEMLPIDLQIQTLEQTKSSLRTLWNSVTHKQGEEHSFLQSILMLREEGCEGDVIAALVRKGERRYLQTDGHSSPRFHIDYQSASNDADFIEAFQKEASKVLLAEVKRKRVDLQREILDLIYERTCHEERGAVSPASQAQVGLPASSLRV